MSAHYDEELELFALGDLEPEQRAAIEEHVTACDACARRLAEAEETLARMSSMLPAYRAPHRTQTAWRPSARVAVASAFFAGAIAAVLTLGFLNVNHFSSDDVRAQVAMIHSHFEHTELQPAAAGAPATKIIFPKDHSWLYAIVESGRTGYRLLAATPSGTTQDLGGLASHGATSSLFIERPPPGEIELEFEGRVVARGTLP